MVLLKLASPLNRKRNVISLKRFFLTSGCGTTLPHTPAKNPLPRQLSTNLAVIIGRLLTSLFIISSFPNLLLTGWQRVRWWRCRTLMLRAHQTFFQAASLLVPRQSSRFKKVGSCTGPLLGQFWHHLKKAAPKPPQPLP